MNHYGSLWGGSPNSLTRLDDGDIPRNVKVPSFIGIPGLACVTHPNYLRDCVLYGDKVGIFELNNELSNFEVRETSDFKMAEPLFEYWLNSKNNEIS